MILRFFSFQCVPLLAAATLMSAPSGQAQPSTNAGQKIIFSSPDPAQIESNLTSAAGSPLSSLQEKLQLFQDSSPVTFEGPSLSVAPPPIPPPMRRVQKPPGDRQQWEFMTPAEILGLAPDQNTAHQTSDAGDNQASLTPLERSLAQRNPSTRFQAGSFYNSTPRQDFWSNNRAQTNIMSGFFGSRFNGMPTEFSGQGLFDNNLSANGDSGWRKIFGMPAPQPDSNPVREQQQDMKQFMELLNRGSGQMTQAAPPPDTGSPAAADSTEPLANQIGSTFAPLSSGIAKPIGLAPLPTLTRQANNQAVAPPAWAPQPPPWLSPTPQPFAVPQRRF